MSPTAALHARWLGTVAYSEAWDLQQQLFNGRSNHLLLLEHPPVYTRGVRTDPANILIDPRTVGADDVTVDRGGDVTFHGPGQLVGYPILNVAGKRGGGMADTVAYVSSIEQILIDTLAEFGLTADRFAGFPGVWLDPETRPRPARSQRSACDSAGVVRCTVSPSTCRPTSTWFDHIVPCGIGQHGVTTMRVKGIDASLVDVAAAGGPPLWATPWSRPRHGLGHRAGTG